jgi:hypothetical protein
MKNLDDEIKQILRNMYQNKENDTLIHEQKVPEENSFDKFVTDYAELRFFKTVIPGKLLSGPRKYIDEENYMKDTFTTKYKDIRYHNKDAPYDEKMAIGIFGFACASLAGLNPEYEPGQDIFVDYFIDANGDECKPLAATNNTYSVINTTFDNVYDYKITQNIKSEVLGYYYRKKGDVNWIKAEGNTLKNITTKIDFRAGGNKITKNRYPEGCKPIPYNVCLKWSWNSLYQYGGVNGGIKAFKYQETKTSPVITYIACMNMEHMRPWTATYTNFYDDSKITDPVYSDLLNAETVGFCTGEPSKFPTTPTVYLGAPTSSEIFNYTATDPTDKEKLTNQLNDYSDEVFKKAEIVGQTKKYFKAQNEFAALNGLRIQGK